MRNGLKRGQEEKQNTSEEATPLNDRWGYLGLYGTKGGREVKSLICSEKKSPQNLPQKRCTIAQNMFLYLLCLTEDSLCVFGRWKKEWGTLGEKVVLPPRNHFPWPMACRIPFDSYNNPRREGSRHNKFTFTNKKFRIWRSQCTNPRILNYWLPYPRLVAILFASGLPYCFPEICVLVIITNLNCYWVLPLCQTLGQFMAYVTFFHPIV